MPFEMAGRGEYLGRMLGYIGAGVYEEMLFRLMLVPPLAISISLFGLPRAGRMAAVSCSHELLFSARALRSVRTATCSTRSRFCFAHGRRTCSRCCSSTAAFGIAAGTHAAVRHLRQPAPRTHCCAATLSRVLASFSTARNTARAHVKMQFAARMRAIQKPLCRPFRSELIMGPVAPVGDCPPPCVLARSPAGKLSVRPKVAELVFNFTAARCTRNCSRSTVHAPWSVAATRPRFRITSAQATLSPGVAPGPRPLTEVTTSALHPLPQKRRLEDLLPAQGRGSDQVDCRGGARYKIEFQLEPVEPEVSGPSSRS